MVKDKNVEKYNKTRFGCESLCWRQMDDKTVKAWCAECDKKCSFKNCVKIKEDINDKNE